MPKFSNHTSSKIGLGFGRQTTGQKGGNKYNTYRVTYFRVIGRGDERLRVMGKPLLRCAVLDSPRLRGKRHLPSRVVNFHQ